jgi:hypothetical protein
LDFFSCLKKRKQIKEIFAVPEYIYSDFEISLRYVVAYSGKRIILHKHIRNYATSVVLRSSCGAKGVAR